MSEGFARSELLKAALAAGLGQQESERTIESGWSAGATKPRDKPVDAKANGVHKGPVVPGPKEGMLIGLDEITPEKVDWLWENRIAPGFITIFAGKTSAAKSFVTCDVVARLSNSKPPPFSSLSARAIRTLFISEDPLKVMLGPRLKELGAKEDMIKFLKWKFMVGFTLDNTEMLDKLYDEFGGFELLVIDPPANFLGSTDEHRNAEVRNMLMALVEWLDRKGVACILICHVNKQVGKGLDAVERIMGSVAWASVARMTLAFAKNPDDETQHICGGTKNNLGELAQPIAYRIVKTSTLAIVDWIGVSETTIENAVNKVKKKSVGKCATEWLEERFREHREWESNELKRLGLDYGLTYNALFKSPEVNALPITKLGPHSNANGERYWTWKAKPGWPKEKAPESSESSESLKANPLPETTSKLSADQNLGPKVEVDPKVGQLSGKRRTRKLAESSKPVDTEGVASQLSELSGDSDDPDRILRSHAIKHIMGMLLGGEVIAKDRIVARAAERDIPYKILMDASKDLNVQSSIIDGQEMWSTA